MNDDATRGLAALLERAARAHHEAFADVAGEDPAWPAWYAAWLSPQIGEFLAAVPPLETLAGELKTFESERPLASGTTPWHEFYAQRLIEHHGPADWGAEPE